MQAKFFRTCLLLLFAAQGYSPIALATSEARIVVQSFLLWDGGSRLICLQIGDTKPLRFVFLNPSREKDRSKSVLCGTTKESLIVVPPKSTLEKMLIDQLMKAIRDNQDPAIAADITSALEILSDRNSEWPRWMGNSSMDEIRRALGTELPVDGSPR